jgi:predicted nucleic acid-binding Zn ribbon protein
MAKVKLEHVPHFRWQCTTCKNQNVTEGVISEMDREEMIECKEATGFWPKPGDMMTNPDPVECYHCGDSFDVDDSVEDE